MKNHWLSFYETNRIEQWLRGSLTGAVASKRVTEARNSKLSFYYGSSKGNAICLLDCVKDTSNRDESRS